MNEQIDIWLVGNTGLRNPNRIQDGFKVFAGSPFVGNLHGKDNEIGFMNYLNEKGIIQNEDGKDESGSHARKWRLMFAKNGFIYPQVKKNDGSQEDLGILDDITPFGRSFLKADTYPAVQECYLRAMSVEQFALPDGIHYFSPLRWLLAIMLELEKRTGTSELSRIEFALWGHTTKVSYFDFEQYGENGWWDFGQKPPMELAIKHIRFAVQSEGRFIINTKNPEIHKMLRDPVEIGPLTDISQYCDQYFYDGIQVVMHADIERTQ